METHGIQTQTNKWPFSPPALCFKVFQWCGIQIQFNLLHVTLWHSCQIAKQPHTLEGLLVSTSIDLLQYQFPSHGVNNPWQTLSYPAGLPGKVSTCESELSAKSDTSADKPTSFFLAENEKYVFSSTSASPPPLKCQNLRDKFIAQSFNRFKNYSPWD